MMTNLPRSMSNCETNKTFTSTLWFLGGLYMEVVWTGCPGEDLYAQGVCVWRRRGETSTHYAIMYLKSLD